MSSFELTDALTWAGRPVARTVKDARPRARVVVTGTICAVGTITRGGGPAYCCTLDDGTGQFDLLFLGRRSVPGLSVGIRCRVEGTAQTEGDHLTVWNPLYSLEAPAVGPEGDGGTCDPDPYPLRAAMKEGVAPGRGIGEGNTGISADSVEVVESAGRFRVYLGAAAGVGKTIAMLDEAHRRRRRGTDVVIGLVESHGRPITTARMEGLETVSRRRVEYHGVILEEMDLDAVLRRRPGVALVDEIAHTNVPGSGRHEKRWQDVLELLEAGIDVITTLNVQHLESVADAVERITDVPVRERIPDWVIRRADQTELVDSSPEQLRRRMLHGNIYPPDQVPQALAHFFRTDNLMALRELALRFVADDSEEELLDHLRRHERDVVWDAPERVMVGVTAAPGTDAIVRRASQMAARIRADLHVVHVTSGGAPRSSGDAQLDQLRQVVTDIGATWHAIKADDPVSALIDFARHERITQMVIGASQRSRWQEVLGGGSVVKRVARWATDAEVDVHIIARRGGAEGQGVSR